MLEIESLHVAAGEFRLRDVHLRVADGECHAVLGPSGSGKSSLLQTILGARPALSGCIRVDGVDVTRLPIERRGLGYVPQQIGLFPHLSVRDNLAYSARARGVPSREFQPLLDRLVAATGIGALLDRRPPSLSGGERQRVGLVRALAGRPRLVLLDEPFTALNAGLRREMWFLLRNLRRENRLTVLLVTHDLAEAYFLADRVSILLDGRLVQQGPKADVYARPSAPEVANFLGIETLEPGRVEAVREGLATVAVGSARLTAPAEGPLPRKVLVSIRGEDVALSSGGGGTESTRNHLPAHVVAVQPGSPLVCVELDAGFPLFALVTRPACEELRLRPGLAIHARIKAAAIHLIPMG